MPVSDHGNTEVIRSVGKRRYYLVGQFSPNGASSIATPTLWTAGWSVARTGVGTYTITLLDFWLKILPGWSNLVTSSIQNISLQWASVGLGTNTIGQTVVQPTLVMQAYTGGSTTPVDIAAAAGTYISFSAMLGLDTVQG